MNNLKRTMSLFIILAMMLTALSFSTAVSAAAESATLDYDDFVYYKHTDGLWYILGFNPDSDITSTAAYSISF